MMFWHKLTEHIFSLYIFKLFALRFSYALTFIGIIFFPSSTNQFCNWSITEFLNFWNMSSLSSGMCLSYNSASSPLELSHYNFFTSWKVLKNIFYGYQLYQKCQSSVSGFSIILKFEFYIFLWVQRFWN